VHDRAGVAEQLSDGQPPEHGGGPAPAARAAGEPPRTHAPAHRPGAQAAGHAALSSDAEETSAPRRHQDAPAGPFNHAVLQHAPRALHPLLPANH